MHQISPQITTLRHVSNIPFPRKNLLRISSEIFLFCWSYVIFVSVHCTAIINVFRETFLEKTQKWHILPCLVIHGTAKIVLHNSTVDHGCLSATRPLHNFTFETIGSNSQILSSIRIISVLKLEDVLFYLLSCLQWSPKFSYN